MAMPAGLKKYWADKKKEKTKRKTTTPKRRTTRKGDLTLKRKKAYSSKKKANKPRKKSSNSLKFPKIPGVLKKVAIGLGAATLATMVVGIFAPQFVPIAKPVATLVAGGIPGVAAELIIDQGILGQITGFLGGGGGIDAPRLASGL